MKRVKIFTVALLALITLFSSQDVYSQRKKASSSNSSTRTSTNRSSSTTSKSISGPNLKVEDLNDCKLEVIGSLGDGNYLSYEITLNEDKTAKIDYNTKVYTGTWSVSGNKITVIPPNKDIRTELYSPDGGVTFKGLDINIKKNTRDQLYAANYNINEGKQLSKSIAQPLLEKDGYLCFLFVDMRSNMPWTGTICKIKFIPDDEDSGTFKISGDTQFMSYVGTIKGEYSWEKDALVLTCPNGDKKEIKYDDYGNKFIQSGLGKIKFPTVGNVSAYINLIKKF